MSGGWLNRFWCGVVIWNLLWMHACMVVVVAILYVCIWWMMEEIVWSQADNLRQQTLQQMHRILTTRQSARALLAINDYFSRLRALSSLWLARPREWRRRRRSLCMALFSFFLYLTNGLGKLLCSHLFSIIFVNPRLFSFLL